MKAALGKNVKVSLPKGVPTDITDSECTEFLDLNKINFAKTERLKSKKDGSYLILY